MSVQSDGWGLVQSWRGTGVEIANDFGGVLTLSAWGTGHSSHWAGCCGLFLQPCSAVTVREVCAFHDGVPGLGLEQFFMSELLYFTLICPLVAFLPVFCAPPAQAVSLFRDEQGQGCVNSCLLCLGNSQGRFECYIWDVAGSESRQPSYFWWELVMLLAFPFFFKMFNQQCWRKLEPSKAEEGDSSQSQQ